MIFATFICLIAINSSANGKVTTDKVTATIRYGKGELDFVKCRGKAEYDNEEEKGVLTLNSSQQLPLTLRVLEIIKTSLQNDTIARSYYLDQHRPVWITMVTDATKKTSLPSKPAVEVSVGLQILPDVQGSLVCSTQLDPEYWTVEIPYCRHDVIVNLIQANAELTILKGLNRVFDCTVTCIEQGGSWMALTINRDAARPYFTNLKDSVNSIFLEEKETSLNSVVEVSIGYTEELTDQYYAEITVQEPTTVVQIDTKCPVDRFRYVYGFFNENKSEIMFFHGSRVLTVSADDREKFVDVMESVSWAFTGAKSLQVGTDVGEGNLKGLTEIGLEGLHPRELKHGNEVRTFLVLPYHAAHQPAIKSK